jgi:hypothetical protein
LTGMQCERVEAGVLGTAQCRCLRAGRV